MKLELIRESVIAVDLTVVEDNELACKISILVWVGEEWMKFEFENMNLKFFVRVFYIIERL